MFQEKQRGGEEADPVGTYFLLSGIRPYSYNSFELMKLRLTEADMLHLADLIDALPLQKEIYVDGKSYLLAHVMTSYPSIEELKDYYLMGSWELDNYFLDGINGYVSLCGHTPTEYMIQKTGGMYLDDDKNSKVI